MLGEALMYKGTVSAQREGGLSGGSNPQIGRAGSETRLPSPEQFKQRLSIHCGVSEWRLEPGGAVELAHASGPLRL